MNLVGNLITIVAILSAGMIYGTDACGALVMRPTWRHVDERTLVQVNGWAHYYGDRRFPIPGILSVLATVASTLVSALGGRWGAMTAGLVATLALAVWLTIYNLVNKPINQQFSAAAKEDRVPENARALQERWDSVVTLRVVLQGIAVAALCAALLLP